MVYVENYTQKMDGSPVLVINKNLISLDFIYHCKCSKLDKDLF